MKQILLVFYSTILCAVFVNAANIPPSSAKVERELSQEELKALPPDEFFAYLDRQQEKNAKPSGGMILRPATGKIMAVRNHQTTFTADEIKDALDAFCASINYPVILVPDDDKTQAVGAELILMDCIGDRGFTILAAPEQGYAEMATDWLVADNPKPIARKRRLHVELMRAIAITVGAGYSMHQPCVMTHVNSLKDLDKIRLNVPGPEGIDNIERGCEKRGIKRTPRASYRTACEEGWAPKPANDLQQKIWDEAYTIPQNPIKIEYDPKTGR